MHKILILAITQSALLVLGQTALKVALQRMQPFGWSWPFWRSVLLNWPFALTGLLFGAASALWMYIVKHYPLSTAYPMVSLSYVFGMLAAMLFFHEEVSATKWAGVGFIMLGCILIGR